MHALDAHERSSIANQSSDGESNRDDPTPYVLDQRESTHLQYNVYRNSDDLVLVSRDVVSHVRKSGAHPLPHDQLSHALFQRHALRRA